MLIIPLAAIIVMGLKLKVDLSFPTLSYSHFDVMTSSFLAVV